MSMAIVSHSLTDSPLYFEWRSECRENIDYCSLNSVMYIWFVCSVFTLYTYILLPSLAVVSFTLRRSSLVLLLLSFSLTVCELNSLYVQFRFHLCILCICWYYVLCNLVAKMI